MGQGGEPWRQVVPERLLSAFELKGNHTKNKFCAANPRRMSTKRIQSPNETAPMRITGKRWMAARWSED
jgi:hypothetical protein